MDFAKSLLVVKPFIDSKNEINTQLINCIEKLKKDPNKDVVEATENSDFELLKSRRKIL